MSVWIIQHPYLFMILSLYLITSISHTIIKVADQKYSYKEDE